MSSSRVAIAAALLLAFVVATSLAGPDFKPVPFINVGPFSVSNGQVEGITRGPVAGAVSKVLPHPTDRTILYVSSPNGGIWKTTNALDPSPSWMPLLDNVVGLDTFSIATMAFDHTDTTYNTIVASIGKWSAFGRAGGIPGGILRTTDGGSSWEYNNPSVLYTVDLMGVAAIDVIVACGLKYQSLSDPVNPAGIYRSTDYGRTFALVANVGGSDPACRDLISDPRNPTHLYASFLRTTGVFSSIDAGATWSFLYQTSAISNLNVVNVRLSLHSTATDRVIYMMFIGDTFSVDDLLIVRGAYDPFGNSWSFSTMSRPYTTEPSLEGLFPGVAENQQYLKKLMQAGAPPSVIAGGQGNVHGAIVAHPTNPNVYFVGGDRQPLPSIPNSIGATDFTGRLFICDATLSPQCSPITHNFAGNKSAPHADCRSLAFDAELNLIEGDDGGVFKRSAPLFTSGNWSSLNGNIALFETHSVAWSPTAGFVAGNQDTGTIRSIGASGSGSWDTVLVGDGSIVKSFYDGTKSVFYFSAQRLQSFARIAFDSAGAITSLATKLLNIPVENKKLTDLEFILDFFQDYAVNRYLSDTLLVPIMLADSTSPVNKVYKSTDGGDNWSIVSSLPAFPGTATRCVSPIFGVRLNGVDRQDVFIYGAGKYLYATNPSTLQVTALVYPPAGLPDDRAQIVSIFVDYNEARYMTVLGRYGDVSMSADFGASFTLVTPRLSLGQYPDYYSQLGEKSQVVVLNTTLYTTILVGTRQGLFQLALNHPQSQWSRVVGPDFPPMSIGSVVYDVPNDRLIVSTLGRGTYYISNAVTRFSVSLFSSAAALKPSQVSSLTLHGVFPSSFTMNSVWIDLGASCNAPSIAANRSTITCPATSVSSVGPLFAQVTMTSGATSVSSERALLATVYPSVFGPTGTTDINLSSAFQLNVIGEGFSSSPNKISVTMAGPGCSCSIASSPTFAQFGCVIDSSTCIAGLYTVSVGVRSISAFVQNPAIPFMAPETVSVRVIPYVQVNTSTFVSAGSVIWSIKGKGFDPSSVAVVLSSGSCSVNPGASSTTELVCTITGATSGTLSAMVTINSIAATSVQIATVVDPPPLGPPQNAPVSPPSAAPVVPPVAPVPVKPPTAPAPVGSAAPIAAGPSPLRAPVAAPKGNATAPIALAPGTGGLFGLGTEFGGLGLIPFVVIIVGGIFVLTAIVIIIVCCCGKKKPPPNRRGPARRPPAKLSSNVSRVTMQHKGKISSGAPSKREVVETFTLGDAPLPAATLAFDDPPSYAPPEYTAPDDYEMDDFNPRAVQPDVEGGVSIVREMTFEVGGTTNLQH